MQKYQHEGLTGFTVRPYRSKRLHDYCARMSKDNTHVVFDKNVSDALRNQGFSAEESPRSVYRVEKLYDALAKFAPGSVRKPEPSSHYESGIALARACFTRPKEHEVLHVLPMTPDTLVRITSNPTGSAGLTNLGCTKQESQTRALERGLQTLKGEKQPEPCIAYTRTSANDKTRLIWGFPYSMTFIEGLVAWPLIQQFKGGSTPMAFAMSSVALGTKMAVASYHKKYAYSLDMSSFDATISAALIHQAFSILHTWYDLDEVEPVSGKTVREIFKVIEHYFIHTTIVMPDGHLYIGKRHGVPSGSYFTQTIDSIVNVIIGGAISHRFGLHVSRKEIFVLGDDLLMWSDRKMNLDTIAEYANACFSVKLHGSEKSKIFQYNEAVHYLGRDWLNGLPDLDVDEVLSKMVYPERFRHYDEDPGVKERQVRMLLLSYAAVYRQGWRIASKSLGIDNRNINRGCANLDVNTYCRGYQLKAIDPDHLSGLVRYQRKYTQDTDGGSIPITAIQYWL